MYVCSGIQGSYSIEVCINLGTNQGHENQYIQQIEVALKMQIGTMIPCMCILKKHHLPSSRKNSL